MRYEILLLAVPEITLDESNRFESQLRDAIRDKQGTCLSFERWGKFRLAYPVNRNEYGVYFLVRLESSSSTLDELFDAIEALIKLKYNELIMRYLINKLDDEASLVYQRPESLEEVPGKVVDSLLREHKIDFDASDIKETHDDLSPEL